MAHEEGRRKKRRQKEGRKEVVNERLGGARGAEFTVCSGNESDQRWPVERSARRVMRGRRQVS